MIRTRSDSLICRAVHQYSASHAIIIPSHKLVPDALSGLGHSRKHDRSPHDLINALGRVEILVLPLPSRIRTTTTQCAAVWFDYYVHTGLIIL